MSGNKHQQWKHCFTAIIAGPTQAGKTHFVKRFLSNLDQMCDVKFSKILFYYGEYQNSYDEISKILGSAVDFREGLPQPADLKENTSEPKLIIIDDLMDEALKSSVVSQLFTRGSHHRNLSVIFITQNLYLQSKYSRTVSLNCHYVVVFKNPRDKMQINCLARQCYPENPNYVMESFRDSTERPFGYLLFDLKQQTSEDYRLRTNIFPDDEQQYVYIPRNK